MDKIKWEESYSVNNQEIDAQHQEWISIFNRLHNVLISRNQDTIGTIAADSLKAMLDYAECHFKLEEDYLKKINYPDFLAHRRLHRDFANQLYHYNNDINRGVLVLNTKLIKLMKNWLVNHINIEDKKYADFAASNK